MRQWVEYEFILSDGSSRYELIDLTERPHSQVLAFKKMHGAVLAWSVDRSEKLGRYRDRLISR